MMIGNIDKHNIMTVMSNCWTGICLSLSIWVIRKQETKFMFQLLLFMLISILTKSELSRPTKVEDNSKKTLKTYLNLVAFSMI